MDGIVTLAAGSDVRGSVRDGRITSNAGVKTAMLIIGACILALTIFVLVMQKWKPQSQVAQINVSGAGLAAAVVVGIFLMAPTVAFTLLGTIGGFLLQLGVDFLSLITG